jgi:flagellar hook-associated protein 1 FlgK
MRSTFYGLEIAKSGLFASQRSIDLTGHNISNSNTVGYTRQRLLLSPKEIGVGGVRFKEITRGYSGEGVRINGIEQVRNIYLDTQYRREDSKLEYWSTRSDALGYIEQLFGETGDTGLSVSITNFFTSLQTLSMNPESKECRMSVLQSATEMTYDFQHIASQMADKQSDMDEAVRVTVIQMNDIATSIADLNDQIFRFELHGEKANDLRDQRNNLLDTLAGIVDIDYTENADGMVDVSIGGDLLVDGTTVNALQTTQTQPNAIAGLGPLYEVTWAATANPLVCASGKLKGYLDIRDGNASTNVGVPYLMSRLDELAYGITHEFNLVHNAGWSLPDASNGNVSATGIDFFTEGAAPVTAFNFSVDAAIQASVFNIATAGAQVTAPELRGDNTNALDLVNLQNQIGLPVISSIEGYEKGFVAEIGLETSHTNQMRDSQQVLVDSLSNQRQAVSGVSVDEEMANLVQFQHSYEASARMITAIDEYLDLLINRMGMVGR